MRENEKYVLIALKTSSDFIHALSKDLRNDREIIIGSV